MCDTKEVDKTRPTHRIGKDKEVVCSTRHQSAMLLCVCTASCTIRAPSPISPASPSPQTPSSWYPFLPASIVESTYLEESSVLEDSAIELGSQTHDSSFLV